MNWWLHIIIGIGIVVCAAWFFHHQRRLRLRAHLMQEALRNRDFTFRLPTKGLLSGERAMQEALNQLGETISASQPKRGGVMGTAYPCAHSRDDERYSTNHQHQPVVAQSA